jgi:hypothetical protein
METQISCHYSLVSKQRFATMTHHRLCAFFGGMKFVDADVSSNINAE